MSKIAVLFINFAMVFVFTNEVISQKKVVNTVQKDNWKDFVSEEGGYKIRVPLNPKRTVSKIDAAFGKTDMVQNRILTKEYLLTIGFLDFPAEINDDEEKVLRYNNSINSVVAGNGNRLISQKDIELNGYLGREAIIQKGNFNMHFRSFIIQQRFFILEFVTLRTLPKTRLSALGKIRDKYFDSFEITKIPEAKFKPATLPDDFGVTKQNGIFNSNYFGFTMQMPDDFTFFDEETLNTLREIAENEAQLDDTTDGDELKLSLKKTAVLGGAMNENFASIVIAAEASFAILQLDLTARDIKRNRTKTQKLTKDLVKSKIDGVDFYRIEFSNSNGDNQVLLFTVRENLLFQIVFTFKNTEDLVAFDKSLKTIKFEKPKVIEAKNLFDLRTEAFTEELISRF
ncbi:MAG TPA: hypothetical protein PKE69_09525 [Pyrinomonadaceae bacterium]|nr:hypothetical protein [Pyrinomonadaceae bacterium]